MSNVKIEATGDSGINIDVTLGANVRKTHRIGAGDSIELSVAGNQKLSVSAALEDAPVANSDALAVGVDVTESPPDPTSGNISDLAADSTLNTGEKIDNPFDQAS